VSNQLRLPARRAFARAPGVIALYPCFQGSPDVALTDRSGAGNNAVFGAGLLATPAWAVANRLSVADSASGTVAGAPYLTGSQLGVDLTTQSLIVSGVINVAATPAATRHITGNGSSTTVRGFALRISATTGATMVVAHGAASIFGNAGANIATGADIHIGLAIDGPRARAYVYVAGAYDGTANNGTDYVPNFNGLDFSAQSAALAAACVTQPWMFGAQPHTGTFALSPASTSYAWQIAKRTGSLPDNLSAIMRRLARHPLQVLTATEWPA
jgi:hypothetical protein